MGAFEIGGIGASVWRHPSFDAATKAGDSQEIRVTWNEMAEAQRVLDSASPKVHEPVSVIYSRGGDERDAIANAAEGYFANTRAESIRNAAPHNVNSYLWKIEVTRVEEPASE